LGQKNLLQLQAKSSIRETEDQGKIHKEKKSDANFGTKHSPQYWRGESDAGGNIKGQDSKGD